MKQGMKSILAVNMLLILVISATSVFAQKASITESKQAFITYPFGDPAPVAKMTKFYPYYRSDGFTIEHGEQEWTIVTLENEYIKVLVAPEMGGKVLGAIEKSTGEEFIYFNKVVKFRDISMRGAWTSGGIEFNFGSIGHAPTTASPVNYLLKENSDGSVSCFVGAPEMTSRTEWRVEIRLPADKSYFETKALWYNPHDRSSSLYNWMTASIDATEDLEYYFPGTAEIGHGDELNSWPVNKKGMDVSYYKNNNFGGAKSYHVLGEFAEHFLCYFRNKEFGLGHWASYDEKPGQKIWIWSLSRQGGIWEDLLTDPGNVQYTEIQTGLLFNQAAEGSTFSPFKHQFLTAGTEHKFTELWFPVTEIGGMVKANECGSLNVEQNGDQLKIGFCANQNISEEIIVSTGGKEIFRKKINLKPTEAFVQTIDTKISSDIQVDLANVISFNSKELQERKLSKPLELDEAYDWNSVDGIFTLGVELEKMRNYKEAEVEFLKVLDKDAFHRGALVHLSGLYYRKMQYGKAYDYALKALSKNTYDPEANFNLGLICNKIDKKYEALDAFSMAAFSIEYRSVARTQIAAIYFGDGKMSKCIEYADKALEYNQNNINALKLKALAYEKIGQNKERLAVLNKILEIDPLNVFARFEKKDDFEKVLNYEMPHEICLEQAIAYYNLGLNEKAVNILKAGPASAITNYWLAYILKDKTIIEKAVSALPHLVYPFRDETADALQWALKHNDNWKTKYYLGLLYWHKGRSDVARKYFNECENQPDYFAFYLARYEMLNEEAIYAGKADLLKALELNNNEWRCYNTLSNYYELNQEFAKAAEIAGNGYSKFPKNYVLAYQLAKTLLMSGEYEESLDVITRITILPNEGAKDGRITYRQACLIQALNKFHEKKYKQAISLISRAREWPMNLGVGRPYQTDERIENYLESLCQDKLGRRSKSEVLEDEVIDYALGQYAPFVWDETTPSSIYLSAILLRKNGREQEGRELLLEWKKKESKDLYANWCLAKFEGNDSDAKAIEADILKEDGGTLFNPKSKDVGFVFVSALTE